MMKSNPMFILNIDLYDFMNDAEVKKLKHEIEMAIYNYLDIKDIDYRNVSMSEVRETKVTSYVHLD